MMKQLIKKYGIPIIVIAALVFGVGSYFSRKRALNELSFKDGLHEQAMMANAEVVKEQEETIRGLQAYVLVVEAEKKELISKVDAGTTSIRTITKTRTELAKVRETLIDKDDIIYNQDLQLQEFTKEVALHEQRYIDLKTAFLAQEAQLNSVILVSKKYFDLWQQEKKLHMLSANAYADYKKEVNKKQFKITFKNIGERLLYAAAGYGLGALTQ